MPSISLKKPEVAIVALAPVSIRDRTGAEAGTVELEPTVFGRQPHMAVLHQVITAQLAGVRAGTQSTKTRAEVRGGGAKPWRQKGTGRARQGSIRAPHWRGGGVALGPKPRSYAQKTPKKMIRLALLSALSDRALEGRVAVVADWSFEAPRTRDARAVLSALGVDGSVLVVLGRGDEVAYKSFRNLPEVHAILVSELNAYDILVNDWVVFSRDTLPGTTTLVADAEPEPSVQPVAVTSAATAAPPMTTETLIPEAAGVPLGADATGVEGPGATAVTEPFEATPEVEQVVAPEDAAPEEADDGPA